MASVLVELLSAVLLFCLVFGMSATVEISHMRKQIHNTSALLIAVGMQFVLLPFVGFLCVKIFGLDDEVGIMLLVITSSPGGSYSNWWCSIWNAELALSVTTTALSTLLSTVMLPANLMLYTRWTYSAAVVQSLDWAALFVSLAVVLGGITAGLTVSHLASKASSSVNDINGGNSSSTSHAELWHTRANLMGNLAGLCLILLSVTVSSSNHDAALWDQHASFYIACAVPPIFGLGLAVTLATRCRLDKPERVAVAIESSNQNTGIATTVALTMFQTERELATAIGVPLYYGIVEAVAVFVFCLICWKSGWTKAPADENICIVIATSYEVECDNRSVHENTAIEVVLSEVDGCGADDDDECDSNNVRDLIFTQTEHGEYVVDQATLLQNQQVAAKRKGATSRRSSSTESDDHDDPTQCSEEGDDDEGEEMIAEGEGEAEADGIMVGTRGSSSPSSGRHRQRRRKRYHGVMTAPPSLPKNTSTSGERHGESSTKTESLSRDVGTTEESGQQEIKDNRIGRAISNLRARATGYRPQASLTPEDDETDDALHNPHNPRRASVILSPEETVIEPSLPTASSSDVASQVAASSSSSSSNNQRAAVISKVVAISNRTTARARNKYSTVATSTQQSSSENKLEDDECGEKSVTTEDDDHEDLI